MKKFIILVLCWLFGVNISNLAQESKFSSGLYFSSHEVIQDKRTSLHLTPKHPFVFNKKFRITFDARFRRGDGYYGLICRVIGNENTNIDLLSNTGSAKTNFWLVYKGLVLFSYSLKEIPESEFGQWIKISVDFDLKQNRLAISLNGIEKSKEVSGLSGLKNFDVTFGACSNPKFQNTDVAPMTLNNIVVTDDKGKISRNWKLAKHISNEVYDEIHQAVATVNNGIWLIDRHVKWTKKASLNVPDLAGMAKNTGDGLVYLIGKTKLYVYSLSDNQIDTIVYKHGCPFNNYYNYFIYNPVTNRILSYDFSRNYLNEFDFASQEWTQSSFAYNEPDLAHHNTVIYPVDGRLFTFGGYGHYLYKSKIIHFQPDTASWQEQDVSNEIHPRYLSAAGLDENDRWLIFGGYGSKSGRQEILPEFYYDLYAYDFKTSQTTKLQQYKSPEIPFVPCEALVKNPESNRFYTLVYNTSNFTTSLKLAEFSLDKPEYTVYSEAIPYNFLDIESWCMFFLYRNTPEFCTVTAHKNDVAIYSLAYPALVQSDVFQTNKPDKSLLVWILCATGIAGMLLLLWIFFKKGKKSGYKRLIKKALPYNSTMVDWNATKRISKSSIYFLGGFQVFDRNGNDISAAFTPTLKQLLIIILLNTVKNGRGISTNKLDETFWFDKSDNSARNNRNVSISKLRAVLSKIGNVDIDQESLYWRVNMSDVYSDYIELTNLCERFKQHNLSLDETEIQHFATVAYLGELLPEFQVDWLDEFKANFSNMILDTLFQFSTLPGIKKNLHLLNHIAECILKFDVINEEAIALKCLTLYKLRKKGLAKTAYDSFAREYRNLLGSEYSIPFNEIIDPKD
jgi:two-component SAPR family response regulator